ncbi:MAG: sulfotransferase [Bacteroidota bacterium]|nr:sulfotransferase [Bacteroidota bacterium]
MAGRFPRPFIIIGMHRSGTSMLSHAFHLSGICMGIFQDHNHEAINFIHLNEKMLACGGGSWKSPLVPPISCIPKVAPVDIYLDHLKIEGASSLRMRLFKYHSWGWKDPRTTFTLPVWLRMFPDAKVIHIVRNGWDVAQSLRKRNSIPWEVPCPEANDVRWGFELWEKYVHQANTYHDLGIPFLEVRYEDILKGDSETLQSLDDFSGVRVSRRLKAIRQRPQTKENTNEVSEIESPWMKHWGYQ